MLKCVQKGKKVLEPGRMPGLGGSDGQRAKAGEAALGRKVLGHSLHLAAGKAETLEMAQRPVQRRLDETPEAGDLR